MDATDTLVEVLKGEGPRVLATLARTIGDLAVAEDALSEATITALDAWPKTGIPDNPRAWLAVVARRKALDLLRRESARAAKETAAFRWGTGPYQIQAHLAAAHSTAASWQETDWDRIVGLYDLLGSITANPVVALNRAVAVTERDGPEAGLAALKTIAGLEYSHLWHAALADNLRRLGHTSEAAGELHTAVTLAPSEVEQRLLQRRLRTLRSEFG